MDEAQKTGTPLRRALVIGNSAYKGAGRLANPVNDANALAPTLEALGFTVTKALDLDGASFQRTVGQFCRELGRLSSEGHPVAAVLFYAGHGVQVDGENYLLPVDFDIANRLELKSQCVELDVIMEALGAAARASVLLLDCCRNNPLPRTLGPSSFRGLPESHGLASVRAPKGVYVAFSTQPHFVALDGTGPNSPFAEALLRHVADPECHVSELLMRVRRHVYDKTKGEQIPWDHSALFEPFLFNPADPSAPPADLPPAALDKLRREQEAAREQSHWETVKDTPRVAFLSSFLLQFPNSPHRDAALARIDKLRKRALWRTVAMRGAAGVAALALAYGAVTWMRFTTLPAARIIGGDIEADDWRDRSSYLWCKARCAVLTNCVAFTYSPEAERCQLKSEAVFYERSTARADQEADVYEIAAGYSRPTETRFRLHWARSLVGDHVAKEAVEKLPGMAASYRPDWRTKEPVLRLDSAACHKACSDLGDRCRGFTHTRFGGGCELFRDVKGLLLNPATGKAMFTPAITSGCDDPDVDDCKPRLAAPSAPAAPPVPGKATQPPQG